MMTEINSMDAVPPIGDGDSVSDEEPAPSPAGVVVFHDAWHDLPGAVRMVHEAVNATFTLVPDLTNGEVAVALSSDEAVRVLNAQFRGQDKPTNVLSFPSAPLPDVSGGDVSGDIVIAYETLLREASSEGKRPQHHLAHLTVHGLLHLAGYDHDGDAEAEEMEALERRILDNLGIADPYRSDSEEDQPRHAADVH